MASILVVCTGNVCRSPIAEGLLRRELVGRLGGAAPEVSSAGTAGWEGSGATPEAIRAAAERGVDISGHRAHRLRSRHLEGVDLVVGMAGEHRDVVARGLPDLEERTFTLKELVRLLEGIPSTDEAPDSVLDPVSRAHDLRVSGFEGNPHDEDIVDPLGLPMHGYRAVAWELEEWIRRLVDALVGPATASAAAEGS